MESSHGGFVIRDRRLDALGDLIVLPDEVICSILELTPRDLGHLACVSRFFSDAFLFYFFNFVECLLTNESQFTMNLTSHLINYFFFGKAIL